MPKDREVALGESWCLLGSGLAYNYTNERRQTMSRHTLTAHRKGQTVVAGFDRPTFSFYFQVWGKDGVIKSGDLEELEHLEQLAVVPDGLYENLIKEAAGELTGTIIKDWRESK
jgi:hypothetical protein